MKKLRSLRSLRQNLVFIANKTPLASLAPSKFVSLLIKNSARFARSVKAYLCCKNFPPLGLCISCCIYTWIMLAAYATCDDYPHNAYPWRFLNLKIYWLFGVHAGIICEWGSDGLVRHPTVVSSHHLSGALFILYCNLLY